MKYLIAVVDYLRELFCRHEAMTMVNWTPEDICVQVACLKCGKSYSHFHLPIGKSERKGTVH